MIFEFLDEFGHNGPYHSRNHPQHNTSPVFGLAGYLMPARAIRGFGTYFLKQKQNMLREEIAKSGKQGYEWEKKGTNFFTANSIRKYPNIRAGMFRMLNEVRARDGKVFYYGREKIRDRDDLNANGLYKTILSHAIRQIDSYCESTDENFVIVMDENSVRKELLETAAKTMFGNEPARRMSSPPFEVESYLNQNIQAADWIATITGRLWNYRLDTDGFENYAPYQDYFWQRIHAIATHSTVLKRPPPPKPRPISEPKLGALGHALIAAQEVKVTTTVVETLTVEVIKEK